MSRLNRNIAAFVLCASLLAFTQPILAAPNGGYANPAILWILDLLDTLTRFVPDVLDLAIADSKELDDPPVDPPQVTYNVDPSG